MTSLTDIRRSFLEYFARHGHTIVELSPLVPRNDPTLMFTNSGMVQFKNVFTGVETRPYTRATTAQKSVRAGGKHNDLENVGHTARHHTFFEMLGNFSFGDYFKADAIELAWTLITKEWQLPADKLLVTVYSEDEDAANLWKKIAGLSDNKIIRIPTSDNFWQMGDTGPCGPCSEIFYDHGDHIPGGPPGSADQDGDRFIEIWNLVFMQYEQVTKEHRESLPKPSIDTGMGLERIAAVLQGKHDNYDIDLFRSLIEASANLSGTDPDGPHKISHRVIADHLRASSFLVADGVLPSNEGRGYVLRRIMRRAMRHAHMIGAQDPLLYKLVPTLSRLMGDAYPELLRAQDLITETLRLEETRFKQTLDRGLKLLDEEVKNIKPNKALSGEVAFKLYDTYGFPLDLTRDVLKGKNIAVDEAGFETAMQKQREDARKAWSGSGDAATEKQWFELKDRFGASEFLGYSTEKAEGKVLSILKDGQEVPSAKAGDKIALIVNQTPFYGESGGQVGDAGIFQNQNGLRIAITDTQKKLGNLFVHLGTVEKGAVKPGDDVEMIVDNVRRSAIRANHSATHLLHAALRSAIGTHISQKGSLVAPERLRFDISHPKSLSDEDIVQIENAVNERIRQNAEVSTRIMTPDEAIKEGAMALFGEKYGEEVRVVSMGGSDANGKTYSVELCGGTHVKRMGDIGAFKIIGEGAVSSGVRRVEALTGTGALAWFNERNAQLEQTAALLKATPQDVPARVQSLLDDKKKLEQEISNLRRQMVSGAGSNDTVETVNGIKFAHQIANDIPAKDLKSLVDGLKKKIGSGVAAIASVTDGKVSLVVGVTDDLTSKISAVDLARVGAESIGGKGGGGRPDMAQAGGSDASNLALAMDAMKKTL